MLKIIISLLVLISAIPIGYALAYLTREELVDGKKYFRFVILISCVLGTIFLFYNLVISLILIFIAIVSLISLIKKFDKN